MTYCVFPNPASLVKSIIYQRAEKYSIHPHCLLNQVPLVKEASAKLAHKSIQLPRTNDSSENALNTQQ